MIVEIDHKFSGTVISDIVEIGRLVPPVRAEVVVPPVRAEVMVPPLCAEVVVPPQYCCSTRS